jgi:hypothetical protein
MSIEKLTTQLRIVRGKFGEIMAIPTVDMEFYLAWDTQELFVGNKKGVKVPYGAGSGMSENAARELVDSIIEGGFEIVNASIESINSDLSQIFSQIVSNNSAIGIERSRIDVLEQTISAVQSTISGEVAAAVNDFLTSEAAELFMTKDEVINELISHTYSKLELENLINSKASESSMINLTEFTNTFKNDFLNYRSVELLVNNPGDNDVTTILLEEDGLYRIGSLLYIKNSGSITKLDSDGYTYKLEDNLWVKVHSESTSTGIDLPISADDVTDSVNKKWNTLLPDGDGSVNSLGRSSSIAQIGANSVSIGINSAATSESSISLGNAAKSFAQGAVQLGEGENSSTYTLKFRDYEIVKVNGKIPKERIEDPFRTVVVNISLSDWDTSQKTAIKSVEGVTPTSIIWCSPAISTFELAINSGVICIDQDHNTLVFKCEIVPTVPISMNIVIKDVN